jgi:hypothetical protein|tara:strand:- start:2571 stop:2900 length:330 start_codon:yes stop_codon:yes gene_type:complete
MSNQSVDLVGAKVKVRRKSRVASLFSVVSLLLLGGLTGREVHRYEVNNGDGQSINQRIEALEKGQLKMMSKPIFIQVRPVIPIPVPVRPQPKPDPLDKRVALSGDGYET